MNNRNPVLNTNTFKNLTEDTRDSYTVSGPESYYLNSLSDRVHGEVMTLDGTMGKTFILFSLMLSSASATWYYLAHTVGTMPYLLILGVAIAALFVAICLCFNPQNAPVAAPVYALLEGVVVGAISQSYGMTYNGIVLNAVALTFGVFIAMLLVYTSGLLRPTGSLVTGIFMATVGIAFVYLFDLIAVFAFHNPVPFIHSTGWIGIVFSIFVVTLAAIYLLADFSVIESAVSNKAPKYLEWYCAYSLLVTIVWLYFEILRLLSKRN